MPEGGPEIATERALHEGRVLDRRRLVEAERAAELLHALGWRVQGQEHRCRVARQPGQPEDDDRDTEEHHDAVENASDDVVHSGRASWRA